MRGRHVNSVFIGDNSEIQPDICYCVIIFFVEFSILSVKAVSDIQLDDTEQAI